MNTLYMINMKTKSIHNDINRIYNKEHSTVVIVYHDLSFN